MIRTQVESNLETGVEQADTTAGLRYAVNESPPTPLAAGLGLQVVILIIAGIVLTPTVVMRAAGQPAGLTEWAIFAGLLVCGITTMLQARPLGRFGAGYVLFMGTSGAFIAISIEAVEAGGLALLATLVVASSLIQFLFSHHLGRLRNIVTPTVGGTVIMLIAVTVFPIVLKLVNETPQGVAEGSAAGPVTAILTFLVILGISLFARGSLRLWGPFVGVVVGSVTAFLFGAFDLSPVASAPWIGLPSAAWPGLDLSFEPDFWLLLVPFVIVTIVGAIETYGDGVAIQRLSRREREPIDFRSVQGAVNADGLGNLLSGMLGTLPNTTYSTSLSVVDLTGVAARSVGLYGGAFLFLIAFCPKLASLLMAVPSPVAGAYIMILLVLLFLHGLRMVAEEGLSFENGMVVCVAFWLAVGFQDQAFFHDLLPKWWRGLLDNGMTAGGIVALLLTALLRVRRGRVPHIDLPLRISSIHPAQRFVSELARESGWDRDALLRLELALEEAVVFLIERQDARVLGKRFRVQAKPEGGQVRLELVSGGGRDNLERALARVDEESLPAEEDAGLRILGRLAERVRHQQFHGTDVLLVDVGSRPL
jgi:NCS2 family nucleobase:cation symporter-2/xanthine permease XanP